MLIQHSLENDGALQSKVDEAMTVYDEYVKTNKGEEETEAGEPEKKATETVEDSA